MKKSKITIELIIGDHNSLETNIKINGNNRALIEAIMNVFEKDRDIFLLFANAVEYYALLEDKAESN